MNFEKRNNFLIGLFVIIGLLILLAVIFITLKSRFIKDGYCLKVEYVSIAGLQEGDEVVLGGYHVGHVEKIVMINKPAMHFEIYLFINNSVSILKGTTAEIKNKSLIGQKCIELLCPEKGEEFVQPNDILKGVESREYQDVLMVKFEEVANSLNAATRDISYFFKTTKLNDPLNTFNQLLTTDVKETIQFVQLDLIKIGQTVESFQQTAESFQQTAKDFSQTADSFSQVAGVVLSKEEQIDGIILQLNHDLVLLSQVLSNLEKISVENKEPIKNTLKNLEATTLEVKELTKDLKQHPWKLIRK